ncbi:methyltransferase domain protein [Enterococcus faecalis 13-SD-W-01]|nr:methyltransferase domain protein [Enterococcus faecalis 13-SD-W-01]
MKKPIYDNEDFFESYSQMTRSKQGLEGAGEWQTLQQLLPDFKGKQVLDLGCGYGWHCIYAAENGAEKVVGVDISEKMLAVAREKTKFENVSYIHESIEDASFEENQFDVVISSLAFHYLESFEEIVKKIKRYSKPDGQLIFSVEHPIFTAQGSQNWAYDEEGNIRFFPVDNYFYEGERTADFLDKQIVKYHRTLTTYLETLLCNGFRLTHIVEPAPPESMLDLPGMKDEFRRPMMLIISAENKK